MVPQYFCYIVAVSFIGGGNRRKPPACSKSHNVVWSTPRHDGIRTHNVSGDCTGIYKSDYHAMMMAPVY